MALIEFVARKPPRQIRRLATRMACPTGKRLFEIDIKDHAAQIEQQRVG
jgi:hypothetical protein